MRHFHSMTLLSIQIRPISCSFYRFQVLFSTQMFTQFIILLFCTYPIHSAMYNSGNSSSLRTSRQSSTCSPSQINDVVSCYSSFLSLYGMTIEQNGFQSVLPRFSRLYYHTNVQSLDTICSAWSTLTTCLSPISFYCINLPVFRQITWDRVDAGEYLQNHAFFEYACGNGNPLFMGNEACLSQSFTVSPLSRRLRDCGGSDPSIPDPIIYCQNALATVECVRDAIFRECGIIAANAVCHAATNIARRVGDVETVCLPRMEETCSSSLHYIAIVPFVVYLVSLLHM